MSLYRDLHRVLNSADRKRYPYNKGSLSENGIYILFENGERYGEFDRIVRVGSHRGINRLTERISEHYLADDHRNSIFRKHIGRCMLANHEYLPIWNLNIKSRIDRIQSLHLINWEFEKSYEQNVTQYIRQNFSFSVIPTMDNDRIRLGLESRLIATLAQATEKSCSELWIGNQHPDLRIRSSKLWNIQHLRGEVLSNCDIQLIERSI